MIVRVDPASVVPAYEQLRAQIAGLIADGRLVAGSQLPTIRQLAADLDLAKDTVARTYELLERDRLVERQGRRGTLVAEPAPADRDIDVAAAEFARVAARLGYDEDRAAEAVRRAMRAPDGA